MPMTKSELMYLSVGLAVGGAVGANWSKIKPMLEVMLGPAAEGFEDAYGDLVGSLASRMEAFKDAAAERNCAQSERTDTAHQYHDPPVAAKHEAEQQQSGPQTSGPQTSGPQTSGRAPSSHGKQTHTSDPYAASA